MALDFGLVEYALWVTLGLWATLFVNNPIAKGAGLLLIILAVLRGLTDKGMQPRARLAERAGATSPATGGAGTVEPGSRDADQGPAGPAEGEEPPRPKQRRRVL